MKVTPDEETARRFEVLIADPRKTENHVQTFLEEHTEFLVRLCSKTIRSR